jgi:hypothetical protein
MLTTNGTDIGSDELVVRVSEDAWNGDAKLRVLIDGHEVDRFVRLQSDSIETEFTNDAWGGSQATDRNLYVAGIDFNGTHTSGKTAKNTAMVGGSDVDPNAAEMYANGSDIFHDVIA